MTKNDLLRRFQNGLGDQMGIAAHCAICGTNLCCAPLESSLSDIHGFWKRCFSECRGCKSKTPPLNMWTFNNEEWNNGNWDRLGVFKK